MPGITMQDGQVATSLTTLEAKVGKKKKLQRRRNVIASDLRTPKYRQRRIELKTLRERARVAQDEIIQEIEN